MGAYTYKTTPSKAALIVMRDAAGVESTVPVHVYEFAFKCGRWSEDDLAWKRYIGPAERAFEKKGIKPLPHGVSAFKGAVGIGDPVFLTHGCVGVVEPGEGHRAGTIVRVISGVKVLKPFGQG
jgi:hypothetical protein